MFGIVGLVLMPAIGFLYVNDIQQSTLPAFLMLMVGEGRWIFDIQLDLLGILFAVSNFYLAHLLAQAVPAGGAQRPLLTNAMIGGAVALLTALALVVRGPQAGSMPSSLEVWGVPILVAVLYAAVVGLTISRAQGEWGRGGKIVAWFVLGLAVFSFIPYRTGESFFLNRVIQFTFPLGRMWPWRFVAVIGLFTLTIANVLNFVRARSLIDVDIRRRLTQRLVIATSVVSMLIMNIMGFARETGRAPFLIYNVMRISDEAAEATFPSVVPTPLGTAVVLSIAATTVVILLSILGLWTAFGDSRLGEDAAGAATD
jgi:hypothetical protein